MNVNIKNVWAGTCLPAKVFPVVMAGVVLFNLWRGVFTEAVKNVIVAVIGTSALWFLCSSGMELLAYMVLAVPVIFIIFLVALIVFDKTLLEVTHRYNGGGGGGRGGGGQQGCDDCGNECESGC
jgi:sterol desaturase/sphingolipid hydroxylase (fatty acid hydroxylase superfamily)